RAFTQEQITAIQNVYRLMYLSGLNVSQAVEQIASSQNYSNQFRHLLAPFLAQNRLNSYFASFFVYIIQTEESSVVIYKFIFRSCSFNQEGFAHNNSTYFCSQFNHTTSSTASLHDVVYD
ncbi:MAG: hypothetical protein IIU54_03400, partial [Phascolarctobacterium sp.]|nr:hypothetical protein [Phascolarctobacterium sp.]